MPATEDELKRALPIFFRVAVNCTAYHRTFAHFYPQAAANGTVVHHSPEMVPIFDAVIEGTLINLRKSAEFFKPTAPRNHDDNLNSLLYPGFTNQGWIVHEDDYLQFHKRVGHLTLEEVREGPARWDTMALAVIALRKWTEFFGALAVTYVGDATTASYCGSAAKALGAEAERIHRQGLQSRAAAGEAT